MKLVKSKNANVNYLAKIVDIKTFHNHPDPEVTKLKCAYVDGYNVIVGIDEQPGKFVYFPTSSQINSDFLSYANLYRHSEKNADQTKSGYFNDNGRVTAIKLRGCVSEGFLIPVHIFNNWLIDSVQLEPDEYENGLEFDTVEHGNKSFWVCKKYVINTYTKHVYTGKVAKGKSYKRVIPEQFPEHYETVQIKKVINPISPDDYIHISGKIHGTSLRAGYVLCNYKPTFWESCANILTGKKWSEPIKRYDYFYGSRKVVKSEVPNESGYYSSEPFKYGFEVLKPALQKGMNMYAEIVGYTPDGKYIQKDYDYGCVPPDTIAIGADNAKIEYLPEKHFKVRVYRITVTNVDGQVHEFSPREVQIYCKTHGLIPVDEYYYGKAMDLYPELIQIVNGDYEHPLFADDWYQNFLESLSNDETFNMECDSPDCKNKVPHEGIVIKIDNMKSAAFKLKCFAFLNKEQKQLDAGESNIEDEN